MRTLLTLAAAFAMLLSFGAVASAEEPDEPCVPGSETRTYVSDTTGNLMEVTKTTTCTLLDDGTIDTDYTYERRVLSWYVHGGGYYLDPGEMVGGRDMPWWMRR